MGLLTKFITPPRSLDPVPLKLHGDPGKDALLARRSLGEVGSFFVFKKVSKGAENQIIGMFILIL
jgi:hypothetical protein